MDLGRYKLSRPLPNQISPKNYKQFLIQLYQAQATPAKKLREDAKKLYYFIILVKKNLMLIRI